MKIQLKEIKVRDLVNGYKDCLEGGVFGFDGKLNIRPAYQREFVYKEKQQAAVIESVSTKMPLNIMYWEDHEDGTYSVIDGQQRTLSICKYVNGDFSIKHRFFHNLTDSEKEKILGYDLMVYICTGDDVEKLDWFETINIAGEKLTKQELRNSVYSGKWLTEAKKYFSRAGCPAQALASDYVKGSAIRQEYLETALVWIADKIEIDTNQKFRLEDYMAEHQHDENAEELWQYFRRVINWVVKTFPNHRREMNQVNWGWLFNRFGQNHFDSDELEDKVKALMVDDNVTKKSGVYPYLITGDEKFLSIRSFSDSMKRKVFEKQGGVCLHCGTECKSLKEMEADHVTPWSEGGSTTEDNCQMLCRDCNRRKSNK